MFDELFERTRTFVILYSMIIIVALAFMMCKFPDISYDSLKLSKV
jgi:hypothetical protein